MALLAPKGICPLSSVFLDVAAPPNHSCLLLSLLLMMPLPGISLAQPQAFRGTRPTTGLSCTTLRTFAKQHVRGPYAQQPEFQVAVVSFTQLITGFILRFAHLSVCARLILKPQLFAVSCVWFKQILKLSDSSVFF